MGDSFRSSCAGTLAVSAVVVFHIVLVGCRLFTRRRQRLNPGAACARGRTLFSRVGFFCHRWQDAFLEEIWRLEGSFLVESIDVHFSV